MKNHHSKNLRTGRCSLENHAYLLTAVTHNRQKLFNDFQTARICISALRRQHQNKMVDSLAFVIMPDHFHWPIQLQQGDLATVMKAAKGYAARQINIHRETSGPVWQQGYHDHALRGNEDLRKVARYLAANPLRAGLVDDLLYYSHNPNATPAYGTRSNCRSGFNREQESQQPDLSAYVGLDLSANTPPQNKIDNHHQCNYNIGTR